MSNQYDGLNNLIKLSERVERAAVTYNKKHPNPKYVLIGSSLFDKIKIWMKQEIERNRKNGMMIGMQMLEFETTVGNLTIKKSDKIKENSISIRTNV